MGHGEIRKAIRELEDQQQADYERCIVMMGKVTNTLELNRRTRQRNIASLGEQMTDLCVRVFDLENSPARGKPNVSDIEAAQAAHDKSELDRLVDYIKSEVPGGAAGMGEKVTDTAIRLLKTYRAALQDIMKTEIVDGLLRESSMAVTVYRIAWDALNASLEQDDDAI